jgi:hypothetical protein
MDTDHLMNDLLKLKIKSTIRRLPFFGLLHRRRQFVHYQQWINQGKPLPPPHLQKQKTVKDFANKHKLKVFVETGTYLGDMVASMLDDFERIYSIELSREIHRQTAKRFSGQRHVTLLNGDSAEILPELLASIDQPCLFWLDAHYSAGFTAMGVTETPIEKELSLIFEHPMADGHVIIIDDARHFTGTGGYPTIQRLKDFCQNHHELSIKIENDLIIING